MGAESLFFHARLDSQPPCQSAPAKAISHLAAREYGIVGLDRSNWAEATITRLLSPSPFQRPADFYTNDASHGRHQATRGLEPCERRESQTSSWLAGSSISPQQTSFTSGWPRHAADCRGRHTGTEPKEPGAYARVSTPPRRHSRLYVPDHAFGPGSSGDGCAPPTSLSLLTMEATGTETTSDPPHPQSFSGDRKQ